MAERTNEKTQAQQGTEAGGIDYAEAGWPQISTQAYVPAEWYESLPEKVRPVFAGGGAIATGQSAQDLIRAQERGAKPVQLVTVINMSLSTHGMHIPCGPDAVVHVKVPPFGALRGDFLRLTQARVSGSRFPMWALVPARGRCSKRETQEVKDPQSERVIERIETCSYSTCDDHPAHGLLHSVRYACNFINSIGEPFADPIDPEKRASYIPPLEHSRKQLYKYLEIDTRPLVAVFATKRLAELEKREARILANASRGQIAAGR